MPKRSSPTRSSVPLLLALVLAGLVLFVGSGGAQTAPTPPTTFVSIEFDDGLADQLQAADLLSARGLHGTFFANSGRIGADGYMTWDQLRALQAAGHEVGGHTLTHPDLATLTAVDARRQVCNDRLNLTEQGLQVQNFAYPFGSFTAAAKGIVADCGYNSARTVGGIKSATSCAGCRLAESIPPADPYMTETPDSVKATETLAQLQEQVTQAEQSGGGWVQLVMHHVCSGCDQQSVDPATLAAFLDWLAPRSAQGTVVATVRDIVGGEVQPTVSQRSPAIVSFEFDDNWADQAPAQQMLADRGFRSTFFVNSGTLGANASYLNATQLHAWEAAGNEVGGHTVSHANLTQAEAAEVQRQVCDDRVALLGQGFSVRNFAYPYGAHSGAVEQIVANCGYNSARDVKGIVSPGQCASCPFAESIPPPNPYVTRTPENVTVDTTLAELQGYVLQAENSGGGWVQLVFHRICSPASSCGLYTIEPELLAQFADWLQAHAAETGTTVQTVNDVIGGPVKPGVSGAAVGMTGGSNVLRNPSLEDDANADNLPDCWQRGGFGTNTFAFQRTADAHTGSFADNVTISSYTTGDRKLLVAQDLGACAPAGVPGHTYRLSAWYKGSGQIAFVAYYRNAAGGYAFWRQSPYVPASSDWTEAVWTTPALPTGATGISFGLALSSAGTLTVDDLSLGDTDQTAPTVAVTAPADGAAVTGPTTLSADASDASGVQRVEFLVDDTLLGVVTAPPYSLDWSSASAVDGAHTVTARAYDTAGNSAVAQVPITTANDHSPPLSSISCNLGLCTSGWYSAPVQVTLQAGDDDSGVAGIYYSLDGSEPTVAGGTAYTGPFTVGATAAVKFRAVDAGGNLEAVQSQTIRIDTAAPTTTAGCGGSCAGWHATPTNVTLTAADGGGSGAAAIYYTLDGSTPTSSSAVYSGPIALTATATVRYRAVDVAGNLESPKSVTVQVDPAAPVSAARCGTSACTGWYRTAQTVSLSATDTGGSGLAGIYYTLDGSTPTTSSARYTSAFSVSTTRTVRFRAYDNAGNAEAVKSVVVQIDGTAPVASAACNGAACTGWYRAAVSVTLSAVENGSGVAGIYYTLDGSTPTTSSPRYTGPISVGKTTTVRFRAWDVAGNADTARSVTVRVDLAAPTVSLVYPLAGQRVSGRVTLYATASDGSGGSGIARVTFMDGSRVIASDTSSTYAVTWDTKGLSRGTHTLTAIATDVAGWTTSSKPVTVVVG